MKKDNYINRKLSKVKQNKKILSSIQTQDYDMESIDTAEKPKLLIREFKCECGFSVRLEGSLAKDLSITKCSKCNSK
jgi:hypothetical protein